MELHIKRAGGSAVPWGSLQAGNNPCTELFARAVFRREGAEQ